MSVAAYDYTSSILLFLKFSMFSCPYNQIHLYLLSATVVITIDAKTGHVVYYVSMPESEKQIKR